MKRLSLLVIISIMLTSFSAAFAQDDQENTHPVIAWTVGLPFKLVGSPLAAISGLIVGGTSGAIRGAIKGTEFVAEKLGDKDGVLQNVAGVMFGALPGGVAHSIIGGSTWLAKGAWTGLQRPFEHPTVTSALEGIPLAIEETTDEASKVFTE